MFFQRGNANQIEIDRRKSMVAAVALYAGMKGVISWLYTGSHSTSSAIDLSVAFVSALYLRYLGNEENDRINQLNIH